MITSVNNKIIKDLMKLKQKKYRQDYYLVESKHLVDEAIKKGVADLIISTKPVETDMDSIEVSKEVMEKLAFTKTPQSIMARCKKIENDEMIEGSRYLILDSLQDPGNVGTLIRTALAFGIDQVILSHQSVDIYNDKVLRSMQGAHFHLSCIYRDLKEIIPLLQEKGVTVVGSALENGKDIHLLEKKEKMAFVLGNEGNGMSQEIIDICDVIGYIPIDTIESLNVAIAGSIMMYHFK
ncbi:TrmH family RNA methyltransferase [Erysipelatoclostridium sp. AM42-17]|uniref:TrmH family RNA methyltransferase n=1 Tax=Erysipelatoclostridium sp. AM42-17 TaxID=2293102 RepID=UPI000E557F25|nr:RNA methyltransferase [Erysipelatoclostridium sp. AM42-17]RHS93305.1 RNA methyltransferase [Erysipelatoclostridium sp. AM42-17]